jgi:hypothetical protein
MLYSFACPKCNAITEDICKVDEREGHHPSCECGGICNYVYIPSVPQIAFLDGSSGSWPSKGERIKKQMAARSDAAGKRQRDRYGEAPKAIPNYKGDIAPSWADARSEALIQGGSEQAASYNAKVEAEGKTKLAI